MQTVNEMRSTTALVEKYIGSAYDKMADLGDNLHLLISLYEEFKELNASWLGALPNNPSTREDGSQLLNGDRYLNTNINTVLVYVNGAWIDPATYAANHEVVKITPSNRVGTDTIINLSGTYEVGKNSIYVYLNGLLQYSKLNSPDGAYEEVDANTIKFTNVLLDDDEVINIVYGSVVSTLSLNVSVESGTVLAEYDGQSDIPLPFGMEYLVGKNNLEVFINGLLKIPSIDYLELSSTSIRLTTPVSALTPVFFKKGVLVSNAAIGTDYQTATVYASMCFPNNKFNVNNPVICANGYTIGDKEGAIFTYSPTFSKMYANGVTAIDPEKTFSTQGSGTGFGCWVRQYSNYIFPTWFNCPYRGMAMFRFLKPISGDVVNIRSFYEEISEYGGGEFFWDANCPATAHNGGTIISPQVVAVPGTAEWYTAPASGTGCWIRKFNHAASACFFGVIPYRTSDSSAAIEAALSLGEPLEILSGTYVNTSVIATNSFYSFGAVAVSGTSFPYTNLLP